MTMRFSRRTASLSTVVISIVFLMGSAGTEDCCGDCQKSLNHMGDSIRGQNCDPSRMDEAREGIVEDCNDSTDLYIGNLVERCHSIQDVPRVDCGSAADMFLPVELVNDGYVDIRFSVNDGTLGTGPLAPGESETQYVYATSGGSISVNVVDIANETSFFDAEIPTPAITIRPAGQWTPYLYRTVTFVQAGDNPIVSDVEFDNFL